LRWSGGGVLAWVGRPVIPMNLRTNTGIRQPMAAPNLRCLPDLVTGMPNLK
jgi:hypothetical protein